jgi:YebC/PmpR family DNA-binding regulatory protein
MSGHSKWSQIKFKKAVTDAKKSKLWSKVAAQIIIASREKGGDPAANATLKTLIDKAKAVNMPNDNIERAIKRGTGQLPGEKMEEMLYEAYGPGGTAILIEAITDNKNRTTSEIKHILGEHGGKLAESGSVKWMFKPNYKLQITNYKKRKEEIELAAIEEGADDIKEKDDTLIVYASADNVEKIKNKLSSKNLEMEGPEPDYIPQNPITPDEESRKKLESLFEALDEQNEVEEIYSNLES